MSDIAGDVVSRLNLVKRGNWWRNFALILIGLLLLSMLIGAATSSKTDKKKKPHIASITINGMITDKKNVRKLLDKLADDKNVKGVIVNINSPGGSTTGGEMLYEGIRNISDKKPITAVFGTVAASAAYMAGIATDHIVTRGSTITGSVGVLFQWPDVSELMKKAGVKYNLLRSGELKATPTPFETADEKSLAVANELIQESFDWFIGLVKERRKINVEEVPGLVKGRIYTGRQALKYKLVDEIGDEETAKDWMVAKKGIKKSLKIIEHKPKKKRKYGALSNFIDSRAEQMGLDGGLVKWFFGVELSEDNLSPKGLVSIWR